MSKVQMPEPAGWISRDKTIGPDYGKERFDRRPIQSLNPLTYEHVRLFTQEQMEAYATAKAREALEEAAKVCDAYFNEITEPRSNPYCDGALDAADILEQRIRALLPSTPA